MCTVGQIIAAPGASNVIAGVVNFTVDIRARRDSVREGALLPLGSLWDACTHKMRGRRRKLCYLEHGSHVQNA